MSLTGWLVYFAISSGSSQQLMNGVSEFGGRQIARLITKDGKYKVQWLSYGWAGSNRFVYTAAQTVARYR